MRKLILAKHARPHVSANTPASQWHLSEDGIAGAKRLGERLRSYAPSVIVSSSEPKALETATISADTLGVPLQVPADLHEHERPDAVFLGDDEFKRRVAELFARPDDVVFGAESANDALGRFARAIDRTIANERGDLAIVSHGTVISLFVAARSRKDGFSLWSMLGLPSYLVLEIPSFHLTELVGAV